VPHAIKQQIEKGKDGLVTILQEGQGLAQEEYYSFMMQKFPKNVCILTSAGLSTDPPSQTIPHGAVIGVDGTVLWTGKPNSTVDKIVDEELKKIKVGWGKAPEIKKVRSLLYSKGLLAEAQKAVEAAQGVKDDAKADLEAVKAEILVRYEVRKKSVTALLAEGRIVEAQKNALLLQKDVKGKAEWEAEVNPLVEAFKTPENDKELKADQALLKLVAGLGEKAPNAENATAFKNFIKKNEGTKAAKRAEAIVVACTYKPS
jgi:hypothetical protein